MKLLHVIRSINPMIGGNVEAVRQISAVHQEMGHQVEILTLDSPLESYHENFSVPVHAQGPGKGLYGYHPKLVPWLKTHAGNYDAILVNGIWQFHSYATWQALEKAGTPYFVIPHGMLDPWFNQTYPLKKIKKWLYWPWAEYRVLRDARAVLFSCEEERLLARQSFWLYRCKEETVSLGISQPSYNHPFDQNPFLNHYPSLKGRKTLLFLGRIQEKKGCDLLLKAFANELHGDDSWRLVMAGPDQTGWKTELEALNRQLEIENQVLWTGPLSGDMKWGALNSAEVFILPSHQENFGLAIVEALACGTPVLISNKTNIWREIDEDNAGIISNDDLEGTQSLIRKWISLSSDERGKFRDRARQCFEKRYEIHQTGKLWIQALKKHGI